MQKISLPTLLKACNFFKKRLQHRCFPVNIPKVLRTLFLIEQLWWLLLNYVSVSEIFKRESQWRDYLDLISLFHYKYKSLQAGQLPRQHLPFLHNLLNFIRTNYLKQGVDDDLRVCVDECIPCGLSITGDIKLYQCHLINR